MTLSVRTSLLATALLLVLATQAPVMAEYEEEEDMDMDLLLDVLRRTRGKPATVAAAPSAQAPVSPVSFYRDHTIKRASVLTNALQHCSLSDLFSLSLLALLALLAVKNAAARCSLQVSHIHPLLIATVLLKLWVVYGSGRQH
jgi:hypothetical protein